MRESRGSPDRIGVVASYNHILTKEKRKRGEASSRRRPDHDRWEANLPALEKRRGALGCSFTPKT